MTKEEFLKNLKTAIEHSDVPMRDSLLETFYIYHPEFRESEDERKRKSLIKFLTDIKEISESGRSTWAVREEDAERCKSFIAYLEKQKDANKAIAAVDAIDTYIDQNVSNAHEMKDSDPDKKYYRGVDDTLANISGILLETYSDGENPKREIKPKFKVGDKIKFKDEPTYPYREILKVNEDGYYFDELVHLPLYRQDEWELEPKKECVEDETMAEKKTVGDTPKKFINGEKNAKFRAGQYIKYKGHIYEITKVEIGITGPFYTVRIVDEEHDFEGTVTGIGVGGEPDMEEVERVKPFRWEPIDEDIDYVSKDYSGWLLTSDTLYHDGYKIRLYDLETRIKKNNN